MLLAFEERPCLELDEAAATRAPRGGADVGRTKLDLVDFTIGATSRSNLRCDRHRVTGYIAIYRYNCSSGEFQPLRC